MRCLLQDTETALEDLTTITLDEHRTEAVQACEYALKVLRALMPRLHGEPAALIDDAIQSARFAIDSVDACETMLKNGPDDQSGETSPPMVNLESLAKSIMGVES